MTTCLRIIQAPAIHTIFHDFPWELDAYAKLSNPIFAGFYHNQPFCIVGIVPQQRSGEAGIWGWNTTLVAEHPYIYGRFAHRLLERVHVLYPVIYGGCTSSKYRWLLSLGATFNHDLTQFRIEAQQ